MSLVFCASVPTAPGERPLGITTGREADAKSYSPVSPPLSLLDAYHEAERTMARVGDATLRLVVRPARVHARRGAYVVVLAAAPGTAYHACDLVYVPAGVTLDTAGIERALVFEGDTTLASPPPESWEALPTPKLAPFEGGERTALPISTHGITASEGDATHVTITVADASARVPRYWLARMLFAVGLHTPALGYVETYGGFFYDDRSPDVVMGLRGAALVTLRRPEVLGVVESLYRAVAPEGYAERP